MAGVHDEADHIARISEVASGLEDFAGYLGTYRNYLLEESFTREEAIQIVRDWQTAVLRGLLGNPRDGTGD